MTVDARLRAFLGRRWQRRQAGGAQDSASSRAKRRPRSVLPSSGVRASRRDGFAVLERRPARDARPAFYALRSGGWRDYVTLVHPPYTLWHLSYVAIGAGLAPELQWGRFGAVIAAFFLAVGLGAHALDELMGRPLRTRIPAPALSAIGATSVAAAVGIGISGALLYDLWLLTFVLFGGFIVVVYNLELLGGRFHNAIWFALAWGAFPALTGYFAMAEKIRPEGVLAAVYAFLLSLAQHRLSREVRMVRRHATEVTGTIVLANGGREEIGPETLLRAPEGALQILTGATTALALALVLLHL